MTSRYLPRIVRLFEKGLDDGSSIGLHGTSLEAILHLSRYGRLPNTGRETDKFYFHLLQSQEFNPVLEEAKIYAKWNALNQYLKQKLPFEPDPEELASIRLVDEFEELPKLAEQCKRHGITEGQINRWIDEFEHSNSRGVVISVARRLAKDFKIEKGEGNPLERYVRIPSGLRLDYIRGIEPIGQYEWDKLIEIQDRLTQR